jgi:glycosyltransferase involved in cell wall biosynthesis/GT2 family glycosyltransferase
VTKPIVSVNMCMYNASRYVEATLQSVFAQTFQDFEIIIVDDGSTDGSRELIERAFPDPRLTIVQQRHLTLSMARPAALAHSRGEFIAFLDTDDLWMPCKLERELAAARAAPDAGLIFSDCDLVDATGQRTGRRFSDQFDYGAMDFRGTHGHLELLRRGNFIAPPTPLAPTAALRALGGFNHSYRHVNDYEMWLRVARRHRLLFINEALAQYRVHDTQFSQTRPDVTLPEQCALLRPMMQSSSYPRQVRVALGDMLLGQHRWAVSASLRQGRYGLAARALLGMARYPDRVRDFARHRLAHSWAGPSIESAIAAALEVKDLFARARANAVNQLRGIALRAQRAPRRILRILRREEPLVRRSAAASEPGPAAQPATQVWVDGTALGHAQTGYFGLLSGLIRELVANESAPCTVHVMTDAAGRTALTARLGGDVARVRFHRIGWRAMHWSQIHRLLVGWPLQFLVAIASTALLVAGVAAFPPVALLAAGVLVGQMMVLLDEVISAGAEALERSRQRWSARLVRYCWRRLPAPRRRAPMPGTVEILFWRGRFKWRDSRRIAVVQDMTTRIHPELHTPGNIVEFDEFLVYVQRHAHTIMTVSEHSRRDIIAGMAVCPESVSVVPMPVHPQYVSPSFSRGIVTTHRLTTPYVLAVGTIEPRKNLRRLVRAFELLREEAAARDVTLVLAGPSGWDPGFRDILLQSDVASRVRFTGFVPLDHLPSLYHFASAVIYPSVYEGFGLPVLEAMCSSAIVLTSRISSLPEVLGPDGILFDPYDSTDIARALLGALTMTPADQTDYRGRCRRRAEAHLRRLRDEHLLRAVPAASVIGAA